jgi:hypothetical protein
MRNKISCAKIESLLLSGDFKNLELSERNLITEHLQRCENCRNLRETINAFEKTGSVPPTNNLLPLGEIKKSLLKRFRLLNHEYSNKKSGLWDIIREALNHRIPIYQAMGVVVILVISFFLLIQKPVKPVADSSASISSNQTDTVQFRALDVFVNLNYLNQEKSGRNLEEDSLLTRYIFRSL